MAKMAIAKFPMPNNCAECPFRISVVKGEYNYVVCSITKGPAYVYQARVEHVCPLKEVEDDDV